MNNDRLKRDLLKRDLVGYAVIFSTGAVLFSIAAYFLVRQEANAVERCERIGMTAQTVGRGFVCVDLRGVLHVVPK